MGIRATCAAICLVLVAGKSVPDERDAVHPVDVAERFARHAIRGQFEQAAGLSTSHASRVREHPWVNRVQEDAGNQIYWRCADCRLEGNRAAVLFVRQARDTPKQPSVEAVHVVQADGSWKVDLSQGAAFNGDTTAPSNERLRLWLEQRTREILSVINARTLPAYSLRGAWWAHHQQTVLTLVLSSDGQAVIITTRPGSQGTDVYDYHVSNGEIVIETRSGPIRLERDRKRGKTGADGRAYEYLLAEPAGILKTLFPDETVRLSPIAKGSAPVCRPDHLFEHQRRGEE